MKYEIEGKKKGIIYWQPSTWPTFAIQSDPGFIPVIERIFKETIVNEIDNVIGDAIQANGSLIHRGHVVAIAQLCAIDVLASYAFFNLSAAKCPTCGRTDSKINKYIAFIREFFPEDYKPFAFSLYKLYRNAMVHSWNLFEVGILPDSAKISSQNGSLSYGLLNFQEALKMSLDNFLAKIKIDKNLELKAYLRYEDLRKTARI